MSSRRPYNFSTFRPTQKPASANVIDRDTPLAESLVAFWTLPDGAGATSYDAYGGRPLTFGGNVAPFWVPGEGGPAVCLPNSSGATGNTSYLAFDLTNIFPVANTASMVVKLRKSGVAGGNWGWASICEGGTASSHYGYSGLGYFTTLRSSLRVDSVPIYSDVDNARWHTAAITTSPADGWKFYEDMLLRASAAHETFGTGGVSAARFGWSQYDWVLDATVEFIGFWNRVLSPAELAQVRYEPYRLLAPRRQRAYSIPPPPEAFPRRGDLLLVM